MVSGFGKKWLKGMTGKLDAFYGKFPGVDPEDLPEEAARKAVEELNEAYRKVKEEVGITEASANDPTEGMSAAQIREAEVSILEAGIERGKEYGLSVQHFKELLKHSHPITESARKKEKHTWEEPTTVKKIGEDVKEQNLRGSIYRWEEDETEGLVEVLPGLWLTPELAEHGTGEEVQEYLNKRLETVMRKSFRWKE